MSVLLNRAQMAGLIANDLALPKWQRLQLGLESLSGLQITGIHADIWEPLEHSLAAIQGLLEAYDLEDSDWQQVSEEDLQRGLETLDAAAKRAIESELDRIVAGLAAGTRKLPVDAIREAGEHRDLIVPRMIRVLREVTLAARNGERPEGNAHFFALFLLSEFQAAEALPAIIEAMSLPERLSMDMFGDAVTTILASILAQFAGDKLEILDGLITDCEVNEFVRWEAAQAYLYLIRDGNLSREDVVRRLQQHLRLAIDVEDLEIVTPLIHLLTDLAAGEALEDIREAYDRDFADPSMIGLDEVEAGIADGDVAVQDCLAQLPPTGIDDTIEELRHWHAFREEPVKRKLPSPSPAPPPHVSPAQVLTSKVPAPAELRKSSGVGRNDPCPCGSGKKFKKCCGGWKG